MTQPLHDEDMGLLDELNHVYIKPIVSLAKRITGRNKQRGASHIIPTQVVETIKYAYGALGDAFGGALGVNSFDVTSSKEGYARAYIASVWAHRCVEILATNLSQVPVMVLDDNGEEIDDHPLLIALHRSQVNIMHRVVASYLIWGETFLWPKRNAYNYYSDLAWLNNLGMDVLEGAGEIHAYTYNGVNGGAVRPFRPDEIVMFKSFNPFDDLRGLSKFETVLLEVGIDQDIARTTRTFFANDARPGVMLIPEKDMVKADRELFMEFWKANLQGSANAGKPVLVPRNVKVETIQRPPSTDDLNVRESVRREICAAFGVPLSIAGAWDDANYQSAPEQRKSLYEETLQPLGTMLEREFNTHVMPYFNTGDAKGRFVLDFDSVLALMADKSAEINTALAQLNQGGISLNEYREVAGLPPVDDDRWYIPSGVQVVASPAEAQPMGMPLPGFASDDAPTVQDVEPGQDAHKSGREVFLGLSLANHPDLIRLQRRVADVLGDNVRVAWSAPDDFHITLVYAPAADEAQLNALNEQLAGMVFPELNLRLGSLHTFDNLNEYAVHFRIRRNQGLVDLQAALYELCESLGIEASNYSRPDAYTPHITIGYASRNPGRITFAPKLTLRPGALLVGTDDGEGGHVQVDSYAVGQVQPQPPQQPPQETVDNPAQKAHCTCMVCVASEAAAVKELSQWQTVATKSIVRGQAFTSYALPPGIADSIRRDISAGRNLKTVFIEAQREVKAAIDALPDDYVRYWRNYDDLQAEIGQAWLNDYMRRAFAAIKPTLSRRLNKREINRLLNSFRDDLLEEWVGTPDEWGALTKVALAGMTAGEVVLRDARVSIEPPEAKPIKQVDLVIDWDLLSDEALDFVQNYVFDLISNLNDTTLKDVQQVFDAWLESGEGLDALTEQIEGIFNNPVRARMIAQTESTRAYNEGSRIRWAAANVSKVRWRTVNDDRVSDICRELSGKVGTVDRGFYSRVLNEYVHPPAHVNCRSWEVPIVDDSVRVTAVP